VKLKNAPDILQFGC